MEVYITDALRTPIGKYNGTLAHTRPDDLAALTLKALTNRNPTIDPSSYEEVILGAANQSGEDNRNVARMALLLAGLPVSVGGTTVNRLCASGLQAIADATRAIKNGDGNVYIAGGVENMTRAPFVMPKSEEPFARNPQIFDTTMGWRFINKKLSERYHPYSMGETAENVAEKYQISRDRQDQFAYHSQQKYQQAHQKGIFKQEIIPLTLQKGKNSFVFDTDEHPRPSTIDQLAALKPAFKPNGTVTAGNASGINDGASALILVSETTLKTLNMKPLARIVSIAVAGVEPALMGIGPVPATQKALQRAGLTINDLDLVELNEAFASQSIACMELLDLNPEIVNVNGGAIALGHPLGCSGARITTTLLYELHRRPSARFGLAAMCIGVGQGMAIVYEKC